MKKKLLIIGAGNEQVEAIKKAKALGYHILVSDGDAGSPHATPQA